MRHNTVAPTPTRPQELDVTELSTNNTVTTAVDVGVVKLATQTAISNGSPNGINKRKNDFSALNNIGIVSQKSTERPPDGDALSLGDQQDGSRLSAWHHPEHQPEQSPKSPRESHSLPPIEFAADILLQVREMGALLAYVIFTCRCNLANKFSNI